MGTHKEKEAGHRVDEMLDKRHEKKHEDEVKGGEKANRKLDSEHPDRFKGGNRGEKPVYHHERKV